MYISVYVFVLSFYMSLYYLCRPQLSCTSVYMSLYCLFICLCIVCVLSVYCLCIVSYISVYRLVFAELFVLSIRLPSAVSMSRN